VQPPEYTHQKAGLSKVYECKCLVERILRQISQIKTRLMGMAQSRIEDFRNARRGLELEMKGLRRVGKTLVRSLFTSALHGCS
jgi:hypothetical protein